MNKIYIIIIIILSSLLLFNLFDREDNDGKQFKNIVDYNINSSKINILKKIDSDIKPLLGKYFGKIKIDKHLLLKDNDSYHIFYFSEKSPNLNVIIDKIVPKLTSFGYEEIDSGDPRTYNYNINYNGEKYLFIFHVLSYELDEEHEYEIEDDNMGIFMFYIRKI